MASLKYTLLSSILFTSILTQANERIYIEYPSAAWNTTPESVDTAHMFVRNKAGGRFIKVLVSETAPDSSIFSGNFSIEFNAEKVGAVKDIDIFVPPIDSRHTKDMMQKFSENVQKGQVQPAPTLFRRQDGAIRMDVYDTEEQLNSAIEIIEKEQIAKALAENAEKLKTVQAPNVAEDRSNTPRADEVINATSAAADKQIVLLQKQQLEAQRRQILQQKMQRMPLPEKRNTQYMADYYSKKGMESYKKNDFADAEDNFRRATELNPNKNDFYLMYGVSLYRNSKLDEAMVFLKIADDDKSQRIEALYYQGLIRFKQEEYSDASDLFNFVKNEKSNTFSASAAFYKGVSDMKNEKLELAKTEFEWVLDNSRNNPELDQRAEDYIESIIKLINYRKRTAAKWSASADFAFNYDSNILLTSDVSGVSNEATDDGGIRMLVGGDVAYQFLRRDTYNWKATLETSYYYSLDETFASADPWLTTASLQYNHAGALKDKRPYTLQIEPYYQTLNMDIDESGTQENILSSYGLNASYTLVKDKDYFVKFGGAVQKDDSDLEVTSKSEDADAYVYILENTHTVYLDSKKKRALITDLEAWITNAVGDEKTFQKYSFSSTYLSPYKRWKEAYWTATVGAYKLFYPDASTSREDTNISLTGTLTKPLRDPRWSITAYASYMNNSSNIEENQYSKYSAMILANYSWSQ